MANVTLETDFAHIAVTSNGRHSQEFLLEHALHMLMNEYRQAYGPDAAVAVIDKPKGYYGR
jgi:hypothetical protein